MDSALASLDGQSFTSIRHPPPTFCNQLLPPNMSPEILNTGLNVIITAAVIAVLFVRFFGCDELVDALTFTNFALLTVGAGGFIGVIAYFFQNARWF